MEIKIPLWTDSDNSYVNNHLTISADDRHVFFELTDPDRRVSVSKEELAKALGIL